MKPHVMAIMSKDLTEEFISTMFITKQIKALAAYQYNRNYNCDITVASAHAAVGAKENAFKVAYSGSERKKERSFKPTIYKRVGDQISAI